VQTVLPAAVIAAGCVAAALVTLLGHASPGQVRTALIGVTCATVVMLAAGFAATRASARRVDAQVRACRLIVRRGQAELLPYVVRGGQPGPLVQADARPAGGDPFQVLAGELEQSQDLAVQVASRAAERLPAGRSDQRVEIFVNVARRMQSLVHREIELLDDLEAQVEDPDLLKGLFTVDHLATRLRRQSESLAVLGGSSSRRQWTRQVTMHEVLRAAIAEVEDYSRVKVVPPVEGVLRDAAVTDVIHLVAELIENATKFSPPTTVTLLRAQQVAAGVAVEVEDRGLGMVPADQQRMNELLADPARMDIDELLRDGRIGLYVVAALARRHGVRVRLQGNIFGGTQAIVVLPKSLLGQEADRLPPGAAAAGPGPRAALAAPDGEAPWANWADGRGQPHPVAEPAQPALPVRHPAWGASNPAVLAPDAEPGQHTGVRPALPRRQAKASAPALALDRADAERGGASADSGAEPLAGQMTPGLAADFLRGVDRAEGEQRSAWD
jgi:signal transduction histidine kinase